MSTIGFNFDALVKHGMIDPEDLNLIHFIDDEDIAFEFLKTHLPKEKEAVSSAIAKAKFSKPRIKEATI